MNRGVGSGTGASSRAPADPVVEAVDLYRFYHAGDDETLALRGVSLRLYPGELVAVTGPSGSGKSTLLSCIAGLDEPDGGSVRVAGQLMSRRPEAERAALRANTVGMLFQTGNLIDHLTVEQNIVLAQRLAGTVDHERVKALLAEVGLDDRAGSTPASLSGGEMARAGLAVALANEPVLIMADEPTGELDDVTADRIIALLRRRAQTGAAVLIVTHNPRLAGEADREITLADGRISP
jgi:putative ABC transport system ATP-binding protein